MKQLILFFQNMAYERQVRKIHRQHRYMFELVGETFDDFSFIHRLEKEAINKLKKPGVHVS